MLGMSFVNENRWEIKTFDSSGPTNDSHGVRRLAWRRCRCTNRLMALDNTAGVEHGSRLGATTEHLLGVNSERHRSQDTRTLQS